MHKALWIARKNYLRALIQKVSDGFGGDDPEFVNQHIQEVLAAHPDEKIEEAIACYEEMTTQIGLYPPRNNPNEKENV